jgi:hypothetical protein
VAGHSHGGCGWPTDVGVEKAKCFSSCLARDVKGLYILLVITLYVATKRVTYNLRVN